MLFMFFIISTRVRECCMVDCCVTTNQRLRILIYHDVVFGIAPDRRLLLKSPGRLMTGLVRGLFLVPLSCNMQ